MTIRTTDELEDAMAAEFAWRKKELTGIKTFVLANERTAKRDLFIRAAIPLLYAHWEGFVRQIGSFYLEFVARRRMKHRDLADNFVAMAVSRLVKDGGTSMKSCLGVVGFFRSGIDSRADLAWRSAIDTKSNLHAAVFQDIVLLLGLDYSRFQTKEKLLDEKLLGNRNKIAHGQYVLVGFDEYLILHEEIVGMMQDFFNQIENSVSTTAYRTAVDAHGHAV